MKLLQWRVRNATFDEIHQYVVDLETVTRLRDEHRTKEEYDQLNTTIHVMQEVLHRLNEKL